MRYQLSPVLLNGSGWVIHQWIAGDPGMVQFQGGLIRSTFGGKFEFCEIANIGSSDTSLERPWSGEPEKINDF